MQTILLDFPNNPEVLVLRTTNVLSFRDGDGRCPHHVRQAAHTQAGGVKGRPCRVAAWLGLWGFS